ncbi:DNA-binding protein [Streptomyces albus]|uniref:DNA-binding protein n=2 Tax=Streptomyces TaxID=1883 RepID=A0A0B5EHV9_STRA4|nr:DNA-binding protein [Streptomyces albus]AOU75306.1 DNA-binding protein [Streptomyces albus]AYN31111.1 DNA-binding protein [Streptomyces albus]
MTADRAQGPAGTADGADAGSLAGEPFAAAVRPLVEAMGGTMLPPAEARGEDVVLSWEGREVLAVRLPGLADSLERILAALEQQHGTPLSGLDRRTKQEIVRSLEARGAFTVRHGVERAAQALGVSRFTVYNYLNRQNSPDQG